MVLSKVVFGVFCDGMEVNFHDTEKKNHALVNHYCEIKMYNCEMKLTKCEIML